MTPALSQFEFALGLRGAWSLFGGSPIMSALADMMGISVEADMYFTEDLPYSVRYEGHDIAQP